MTMNLPKGYGYNITKKKNVTVIKLVKLGRWIMKYRINYYYDGKGSSIVEAKNEKEAEEKYHNGDVIDDHEESENYCIDTIEKEE